MSLSLSQIRGIGLARLKALNDAGIWTARDLALMLPRDYRDLTNVTPLAALQAGVPAAVRVSPGSSAPGSCSSPRYLSLMATRSRRWSGTISRG